MGRIFIFFSTDNGHTGKFIFNMENLKKMNLDKFDLAILKVLQQNARASLNDIGAAVGLSSTPCWNRIKRMESAGVIRGYTVDIDPASLGFMDTVIVRHAGKPQRGNPVRIRPRPGPDSRGAGGLPGVGRLRLLHPHRRARHAGLRALLREQLYRIPGIRHSKSCFCAADFVNAAAASGAQARNGPEPLGVGFRAEQMQVSVLL